MKRTILLFAAILFATALAAGHAPAQEIIIWYDEQGAPHTANSPRDIPAGHRAQAHGVLTTIDPARAEIAVAEGVALGSDPLLYKDGLGLFQPFEFELDLEKTTGYVFVGTKHNLVKARAASAAREGGPPPVYQSRVNSLATLPIAFYSWRFKPVLMLLLQDGKIIKGEEGFDKDTDPEIGIPAYVKSFPYEVLDFGSPVQIQLYSREGQMVQLNIDLPAYR